MTKTKLYDFLIALMVTEDMAKKISAEARRRGQSRSELIRSLISEHLEGVRCKK